MDCCEAPRFLELLGTVSAFVLRPFESQLEMNTNTSFIIIPLEINFIMTQILKNLDIMNEIVDVLQYRFRE